MYDDARTVDSGSREIPSFTSLFAAPASGIVIARSLGDLDLLIVLSVPCIPWNMIA